MPSRVTVQSSTVWTGAFKPRTERDEYKRGAQIRPERLPRRKRKHQEFSQKRGRKNKSEKIQKSTLKSCSEVYFSEMQETTLCLMTIAFVREIGKFNFKH